jgi:hypothetical protein
LCLAETDYEGRGTFAPLAVCKPLTDILKRDKPVKIDAFQQHLKNFITPERGDVFNAPRTREVLQIQVQRADDAAVCYYAGH